MAARFTKGNGRIAAETVDAFRSNCDRKPLLYVEISGNYFLIAPVGLYRRQCLVQRLAARMIPFAHRNPDPCAEPAFVIELGTDKLVIPTQRSFQEGDARRGNLR